MWSALILVCGLAVLTHGQTEDEKIRDFLEGPDGYNARAEAMFNKVSTANWAYYTNITDENQEKMTAQSLISSEFAKNESKKAAVFDLSAVEDPSLVRYIEKILDVGISGYDDQAVLERIANIGAQMTGIYSSAKWCPTEDTPEENCHPLDPDLTDILTDSRDYKHLANAWKGWRDVSGAKMRSLYREYVELMNQAIQAGGKYADMGEYYRSWYEQDTFEQDVRNLFNGLAPLYDELHAYVRRKLKEYYKDETFPSSGHIPAHIFGNMWAQSWGNIYSILEPYPGQGRESLTTAMEAQNYNVTYMYQLAEEFFLSIGLEPMPESFWRLSMLEKPPDRQVVCHASAWDFYNGTDFRIKQCTTVTEDQLITVHHEMGHIQYYLEYMNQPVRYRRGANPGFHEAVADIASLSFQTPEHLLAIGLIPQLPAGDEGDINFLFQMALDKVAFLPFGYLIDQWRWSVYRGETTPENYNRAWWDLRCKYQGVSPPVPRSEEDFDPGAKYHIPGNTPYIRYFVSFVLQFQWHKALCELIGKAEPLHRCDIYQNKTAGERLRAMLQMGSSKPWGEAMLTLTNGTSGETDRLSAQPLLDYFKPLQDWLKRENEKHGETPGWDKENCPSGSFVEPLNPSGARSISSTGLPFVLLAVLITLLTF